MILFLNIKFRFLILTFIFSGILEAKGGDSTPVVTIPDRYNIENQSKVVKNNQLDIFGNLYLVNDNSLLMPTAINDNQSSVWIIFQNDCKSCHRMMVESKCLKGKSKVKNYFVGIQSSPEVMAKAIKKYIQLDQVLYSKGDLVEKLKIEVTPTVYIFKNSELVKKIENYVSCSEIKKYI